MVSNVKDVVMSGFHALKIEYCLQSVQNINHLRIKSVRTVIN